MAIKLVVKTPFNAWGKEFKPGQVVTDADTAQWPEGTLQARLDGEYLSWEEVKDTKETKASKG